MLGNESIDNLSFQRRRVRWKNAAVTFIWMNENLVLVPWHRLEHSLTEEEWKDVFEYLRLFAKFFDKLVPNDELVEVTVKKTLLQQWQWRLISTAAALGITQFLRQNSVSVKEMTPDARIDWLS